MLAAAADHFGRRAPLFNTSGQSYRALGSAGVDRFADGGGSLRGRSLPLQVCEARHFPFYTRVAHTPLLYVLRKA